MRKKYNIRWKQSDSEQLTKAVKNFNAKIRRLEKKNPEMKNALPEKVTVKQMKELIKTRQDLNREIKALQRFSKRGAEKIVSVPNTDYNLKITKWQRTEMNRRAGIINRKRQKRLKELEEIVLTSRGQELGYTKGEFGMTKAEKVALAPTNAFTPRMTIYDLKKKYKHLMKESQTAYWNWRDEILRNNYIRSLEENFNVHDIEDVVEAIRNMDFKKFKKIYDKEGGNFEFNYPPSRNEYESYVEYHKSLWVSEKGK